MDETEPPPSAERDADWIAEIAAGDRGAFEALFRAYERRLFRFFARLLRDEEAAAELTTDVMVEVWKGAGRFRGTAKPSTWIFGIAHHKAMDALRRRRFPQADLEEAAMVADPAPDPEARAVGGSLQERLRRALVALSPSHREVVELAFFQGLAGPEIAAILGCPLGTVKTRLFYARKQLAPVLTAAGLGRTDG